MEVSGLIALACLRLPHVMTAVRSISFARGQREGRIVLFDRWAKGVATSVFGSVFGLLLCRAT